MRRNLLIVLALIALLFVVGWAQTGRTRWEYKEVCSSKDLNKLGDDGWELVSAHPVSISTCYVFKRAK